MKPTRGAVFKVADRANARLASVPGCRVEITAYDLRLHYGPNLLQTIAGRAMDPALADGIAWDLVHLAERHVAIQSVLLPGHMTLGEHRAARLADVLRVPAYGGSVLIMPTGESDATSQVRPVSWDVESVGRLIGQAWRVLDDREVHLCL